MWHQTEKVSFFANMYKTKHNYKPYMLLHNLNINVAIAVLFLYWKSLYDLQKPKYKNITFAPKGHNWAWSP